VYVPSALPTLVVALLFPTVSTADCIAFTEAKRHIGETRCVSGKVLRVKEGNRGVTFLDFCEDYRVCPFTVVVFPGNLRRVGDVRQLQGKVVEIHGPVKLYDGRAEIILERAGQLAGDAGQIPPLPKGYDVEKKGRIALANSVTQRLDVNLRRSVRPRLDRQKNRSIQWAQSSSFRYTIPFFNSANEYFVPRQTTPPRHSVSVIERSMV
jgi:hypothetical protein